MPTRSIRRASTILGAAIANKAPIYVDSDDDKLKMIPAGSGTTEVEIHTGGTAPLTTVNLGAVNGATVSAVERGNSLIHQSVITLAVTPLTLVDANQGAGVKIYDFPLGQITILGATGSVKETTTSILTDTLNASVTYNWGVGTVTQANGTLATTEQNIIATTNGTASATINTEAAASTSAQTTAPANFNGNSTAIDAYFNVAIAAAGDIDANATTTWNGTITLTWLWNGKGVAES